jgi:adenylate kinase family enzyme
LTVLRIHVAGASGTGTSTLGKAFAEATGAQWLDLDDFYWLSTSPPFQVKRSKAERLALLVERIRESPDVVVSGSLMQWGREVEDGWDLIVFLTAPTPVRIDRLRAREMARYGSVNPEFLVWAERYDDPDFTGRSRALHERWLAERSCPILRLDAELPLPTLVRALRDASAGAA